MNKRLKAFLLVGAAIVTLAGQSNANAAYKFKYADKEKKVVNIATTQSNGLMIELAAIAQENKYIEEELGKVGYKPKYIGFAGAGPAINEAFVAKKIDFAAYGDMPPVVLKSKGIDISIIGITSSSYNMAFIVQKDSKINSVSDIKGKRIIVGKGTILQRYFGDLTQANKIKESSIEVINAVADAQSTFIAKKAEGWFTSYAQAKWLEGEGKAKIIDTTIKHPEWADQTVLAGRKDYIKDNPKVAVALSKANIRAWNYAKNNPDKVYKILAKGGIPENAIKEAYGYDGGKFDFFNPEITKESISKLKKLNSFLVDQKIISSSVNIDDLVDNSYFKKASADLKK